MRATCLANLILLEFNFPKLKSLRINCTCRIKSLCHFAMPFGITETIQVAPHGGKACKYGILFYEISRIWSSGNYQIHRT